jgi:enoyl-CoA hydratase/carnithine racemase
MSEAVLYERNGHVGRVTLNRPAALNALDQAADRELAAIWDQVEHDPEVWVAVLTGAGRAFCAGADTRAFGDATGAAARVSFGGLTGIDGSFVAVSKPIVAAVHGWAVGGGFELAMACDIIMAGTSARFSIPEPRIGVLGGALAVHRALRHLPHHIAMELILTGRPFTAEEAYRHGLVNAVIADEDLARETDAIVACLLECSPGALRATKVVAYEADGLPLIEAITRRYAAVGDYLASEDYREALTAIGEHRPPRWRGYNQHDPHAEGQ